MTEKDIQRSVMVDRYRQSFVMPNYTPRNWWECDVFEITKAGYFYEYEIKLTVSDFTADKKKSKAKFNWDTFKHEDPTYKHQIIGHPHGPVCFSYVVPEGLLDHSTVPNFAGLIEAKPGGKFCGLRVIKKAPRLHETKIDPKIMEHAKSIAYWRFHGVFIWGKHQAIDEQAA